MAIKPMQKKNKKTGGGAASGKGGSWGGKGGKSMSAAEMQHMQIAQMYYMKGLEKGMGKGGSRSNGKRGGSVAMMPAFYRTPPGMAYGRAIPTRGSVASIRGSVGGKGGKSKGVVKKPLPKHEEKLKKVDASRLVWICGLSPETKWKALEKHLADIAKPTVTSIREKKNKEGKITAMVAMKSPEDVEAVVDALNGSELDGEVLEVDKWEKGSFKKDKEDKGDRPKRNRRGGAKNKKTPPTQLGKVVNLKFAKGARGKVKDEALIKKLQSIDPSCKVWIGGLSEKTTKQALTKHFADIKKPKIVDMMRKGKAVVAYDSEEDAVAAIAALNGTELNGETIEVDVWTKSEKKPRERKEKKGKEKKEETDE